MSRLLKLEQSANMCDISVTLDVSRFVKSILFKAPQFQNIPAMLVTFDVFKPVELNSVIPQLRNI